MKVLSFDKPAKIASSPEDLGGFDGGPPGGYIPNMSAEDMSKYKAKKISGEVPRVEVRVTLGSQVLIKVKNSLTDESKLKWPSKEWNLANEHGCKNIKMSMNGPIELTFAEWEIFKMAVDEVISITTME